MSTENPTRTGRTRTLVTFVATALLAVSGPALALQGGSLEEGVANALRAEGPALSDVSAEVENGVVTLEGEVDSLAARDLAEEALTFLPSVRAVVNRIDVRDDRDPAAVEEDYRELLRDEPATESFQIDAVSRDGVLVLGGNVDSSAERQLAETMARRVRGVREIRNEIEIRPGEDRRGDAEIDREIHSLLKWDARVDDSLMAVAVEDGIVSLAGVAPTPMQKTQAIVLASSVRGVKAVEANELIVQLEDDPERVRKVPAEAATDAEIQRALEKALASDPRVPEEALEVEVRSGAAHLRGEVGRLSTKLIAGEDAENVVGVVRVVNVIDVSPTPDLTAAQIRDNVKGALTSDPLVDPRNIEVSIDEGVVTLEGKVVSERMEDRAIEAAARARGVLEVQSNLVVVSSATTS